MIYYVIPQTPYVRQMTLEELLSSDPIDIQERENKGGTRTYEYSRTPRRLKATIDVRGVTARLEGFIHKYKELVESDKTTLYETFFIPKKSGGLRRIDSPDLKLTTALRELKSIFEDELHVLHHTSAYAYVKGRSTIDSIRKHQKNESKWFGKYDITSFFGSTTQEFVMKMLSSIFPFSEIMKNNDGKRALETCLSLAFLNGGLPQGTPISPMLTNIIMIPIDFRLTRKLRDFNRQNYIYTRYADDFLISSRYTFDPKEIEKVIFDMLEEFGAPFTLNQQKTRYGSSSGSNWNLGVMLNKDNQITIGHKKKRHFQAMLTSYVLDKKNGKPWSLSDVQVLEGLRSYYKMVEGEVIDKIVEKIGSKFGADIVNMIKQDLKTL